MFQINLLPIDASQAPTIDLSSNQNAPETLIAPTEEIIQPATVFSNGYDNIAARDYAYKWAINSAYLRNNLQYPYYQDYYNCDYCWDDCTDFVSQAIYAGGMKMRYGINYQDPASWSYGNLHPSNSWGGANPFYNHWKSRAGVASYVSQLITGDPVSSDFEGDGDINHTAIITKNTGDDSHYKFLTQHSDDKVELTTLADWYAAGYKNYGYTMDKASN